MSHNKFSEKKLLEFGKKVLGRNYIHEILTVINIGIIVSIIVKNIFQHHFYFSIYLIIIIVYCLVLYLPEKKINVAWKKDISDHHKNFFENFTNFVYDGMLVGEGFRKKWYSWYLKTKFIKKFNHIWIILSISSIFINILFQVFEIVQVYNLIIFPLPTNTRYLELYSNIYFSVIFPASILVLSFSVLSYMCECYKNRFRWLIEDLIRVEYFELSKKKKKQLLTLWMRKNPN